MLSVLSGYGTWIPITSFAVWCIIILPAPKICIVKHHHPEKDEIYCIFLETSKWHTCKVRYLWLFCDREPRVQPKEKLKSKHDVVHVSNYNELNKKNLIRTSGSYATSIVHSWSISGNLNCWQPKGTRCETVKKSDDKDEAVVGFMPLISISKHL